MASLTWQVRSSATEASTASPVGQRDAAARRRSRLERQPTSGAVRTHLSAVRPATPARVLACHTACQLASHLDLGTEAQLPDCECGGDRDHRAGRVWADRDGDDHPGAVRELAAM